jgi:aspartate beta-hydroxylase
MDQAKDQPSNPSFEINLTREDHENLAVLLSESKKRFGNRAMERLSEAFAIATGKKPPKFPDNPMQPNAGIYFEDLTSKPWHDACDFEVAVQLENASETIKNELINVLDEKRGFQQTIQEFEAPAEWKAFYLKQYPVEFRDNLAMCPETARIITNGHRVGELVMFSGLNPGGHIKPHGAVWNVEIVLHFGLIIPEGSGLRVGGEALKWEEGKCLLFDASFEHEAWNYGDFTRFILLVNMWHPDLTYEEVETLDQVSRRLGSQRFISGISEGKDTLKNQKWWV